jgi:hypothetical protein
VKENHLKKSYTCWCFVVRHYLEFVNFHVLFRQDKARILFGERVSWLALKHWCEFVSKDNILRIEQIGKHRLVSGLSQFPANQKHCVS